MREPSRRGCIGPAPAPTPTTSLPPRLGWRASEPLAAMCLALSRPWTWCLDKPEYPRRVAYGRGGLRVGRECWRWHKRGRSAGSVLHGSSERSPDPGRATRVDRTGESDSDRALRGDVRPCATGGSTYRQLAGSRPTSTFATPGRQSHAGEGGPSLTDHLTQSAAAPRCITQATGTLADALWPRVAAQEDFCEAGGGALPNGADPAGQRTRWPHP